MKRHLIAVITAVLLLAGCASQPPAQPSDQKATSGNSAAANSKQHPSDTDTRPQYSEQALGDTLTAAVAAQKGKLKKALALYVRQANSTQDPKVIAQAARLALYMHKTGTALKMATLWRQQQPDSLEAWQITTFAHILQGLPDAVADDIDHQIALSPKTALNDLLADRGKFSGEQLDILLKGLSSLTDKYPKKAPLWFARAIVKRHAKQLHQALDACNHALKLRPDYLEAALLKSRLLTDMNQPDKAIHLLATLQHKHPQKTQVAAAHIKLLLQAHKHSEAATQIKHFLDNFPDNGNRKMALALFSLKQNDGKNAATLLDALQKQSYQPGLVSLSLGRAYEQQQQWQKAIDNYLQVKDGRRLRARVAAARLYYQHQQAEKGAQLFQTLRNKYAKQAAVLYASQASILAKQKQDKALAQILEKGLADFPDNADLLYIRAMTKGRHNNFAGMKQDLQTIIANHPNDVDALNALGYTLSNHSDKYQEAWYYIKRAHAREPDNPAIQDSLGWILFRLQHYKKALPLVQKAYDAKHDPEVAAHLVQVLRALGKTDQADKQLQHSLDSFPDNPFLIPLKTATTSTP